MPVDAIVTMLNSGKNMLLLYFTYYDFFGVAVRKQVAGKAIFNELQSIMTKHKLNDIEVLVMF